MNESGLGWLAKVGSDNQTMAQVAAHSAEQVMHGIFPKRVEDAVLDSINDHEGAAREFARLILRLLVNEHRLEA